MSEDKNTSKATYPCSLFEAVSLELSCLPCRSYIVFCV
jgi:hypothetical protein